MSVARVTELSATSSTSFDDAVSKGIERASKTLRNVKSAWIKDHNVEFENGQVSAFRVNTEAGRPVMSGIGEWRDTPLCNLPSVARTFYVRAKFDPRRIRHG